MGELSVYCTEVVEQLRGDLEDFAEHLRRRWAGESGPALGQDRSWSSALLTAYSETPEDLRHRWAKALDCVLGKFSDPALLRSLGLDQRIELLGALELAQAIDWAGEERENLESRAEGWLRFAVRTGELQVRDLWQEDGFLGQPERDVVTSLLRLAAHQLPWRDELASEHWARWFEAAKSEEPAVPIAALAWRAWELARWAIEREEHHWLAKRVVDLKELLQAADFAPGNLTRLFFQTEFEHGIKAVSDLIQDLLLGLDDPIDKLARIELLQQLDYFGVEIETFSPEARKRRAQLWTEAVDSVKLPELPAEERERIQALLASNLLRLEKCETEPVSRRINPAYLRMVG